MCWWSVEDAWVVNLFYCLCGDVLEVEFMGKGEFDAWAVRAVT